MKLIWTKSKAPLSVLIRWGLNEPVSHFAIVFDDFLVFHSNLVGVHMVSMNRFLKSTAQIVYEKNYAMVLEDEEAIYRAIISKHDGEPYDFGAFFYFIWRVLLHKFFKTPVPATNPRG